MIKKSNSRWPKSETRSFFGRAKLLLSRSLTGLWFGGSVSQAILQLQALTMLVLVFGGGIEAYGAVTVPARFDMGTSTSPTEEGWRRISPIDAYQSAIGYGWTTAGQSSFDRDRPLQEVQHGGNQTRVDLLYHSHATPVLRDGVSSRDDMTFRVDVDPGKYRVHVLVGDLHAPLESLAVSCNGETIGTAISAKQILGRALPQSTGMYRWLRFDVDAGDGKIDLRFYGDESQYQADIARYEEWFPGNARVESYRRAPWDAAKRHKFDAKGPFQRNSVLAIAVLPAHDAVLKWNKGTLTANGPDDAAEFAKLVNDREFSEAARFLDSTNNNEVLQMQGLLALIGHPELPEEMEADLIDRAAASIEAVWKNDPENTLAIEARDSLAVFRRARHRFLNRGFGEEGHFQENRKVVSLLRIIQPNDLLYYKAKQYEGRASLLLDPHRWVYISGDGMAAFRKLATAFPNDRYARFFLTDKWTPDEKWHLYDHRTATAGAPEWARAVREAYGLMLDLSEWWADNKTYPDGSIGGGWGDDVEFVAFFGMMGFISEGSSPKSLALTTNLLDGLWKYGGIDQQAGFCRVFSDTEHSSEWTGDALPIMLTLRYGDPVWVERSLKTARLMRDLWMDRNDKGNLQFRANFLSSVRVGEGLQANDSWINYRATLPALAVYRYNRHPEVARLFVEWADSWLDAALSTERGKPRGIIPAEVGFPLATIGGTKSPNWYTSTHPPGTVNYDWTTSNYRFYVSDLLFLAHEITGDSKYLEPFRLEKELVDRYRADPASSPERGSAAWAGMIRDSQSRAGISADSFFQRAQQALEIGETPEAPQLVTRQQVIDRSNFVVQQTNRYWPVLTTETSATDRVAFAGIADPFFLMTGTRDLKPSVTYSGVGRDFAAYVERADERTLKLFIYNFAADEVPVSLTTWKLDLGGTYQLRAGIDSNDDGNIDTVTLDDSFVLHQRGQQTTVSLAGRQTTMIEIRQTAPGRGGSLAADLAVVPDEIKYSIWTRELQATIHNIGSLAAGTFEVGFVESSPSGRKLAGVATIPKLTWSEDLESKSMTVAVPYVPQQSNVRITVVIDEVDRINEISERNNTATRRFEFDLEEVNAPRNKVGEIGGDVTGEIEAGIR